MDMAGRRAKTIERLHLKYGPVVQLGPNEISFNSIEAINIIYGSQSECIKSPWYSNMARNCILSLRHLVHHRDRRKKISRAFSPASAYELEPNVVELVQRFISTIDKLCGAGSIEMRYWFRMLAFDLSGMALIGSPYGGLEASESP